MNFRKILIYEYGLATGIYKLPAGYGEVRYFNGVIYLNFFIPNTSSLNLTFF